MSPHVDVAACAACHCLAARRRAREISRLYDRYLRPHGLRVTQFSVLVALELGAGAPLGTLADALGLDRTTLTRAAAVMRSNGWIAPSPSKDGRERPLTLTSAGRRKLIAAHPAWTKAQRAAEQRPERAAPKASARSRAAPSA